MAYIENENKVFQKVLNKEMLTEEEVHFLVCECEEETEYGENMRWTQSAYTVVEIEGRYFGLNWYRGLTEMQPNEYYPQTAIEVVKAKRMVEIEVWEEVE